MHAGWGGGGGRGEQRVETSQQSLKITQDRGTLFSKRFGKTCRVKQEMRVKAPADSGDRLCFGRGASFEVTDTRPVCANPSVSSSASLPTYKNDLQIIYTGLLQLKVFCLLRVHYSRR